MNTRAEIEARRRALLDEMEGLRSMKRGSVAEQFLKVPHKDSKEPVLRGPYFVFVQKVNGKSRSKRLRSAEEVRQVRGDVANFRRFEELTREFAALTEQLGEIERDAAAQDSEVKKKSKSRSSKAKRSSES